MPVLSYLPAATITYCMTVSLRNNVKNLELKMCMKIY